MPKNVLGTVFKILLASLVLGFILKFLEIDPKDLLLSRGSEQSACCPQPGPVR